MQVACVNGVRDHLRHIAVLAAALGGLFLGGCTEKPDRYVLKNNHVWEDHLPAAAANPHARGVEVAHLPPPAVRARPPKAAKKGLAFDPTMLVGLGPEAIDRMLGKPVGTRQEATTVEWIYRGGCSLRIFFYPDIATGTLRALQYDIKQTGPRAARLCQFPDDSEE